MVYEKRSQTSGLVPTYLRPYYLLIDLNSQIFRCKFSAIITRPSPSWPSMLRERRGRREL